MPELPEVETTKRGIEKQICHKPIVAFKLRQAQLRWPVPTELVQRLPGLVIQQVRRRAKYLILSTKQGHLLVHLGMSGHLKLVSANSPVEKHDHIDLVFNDGICLRYNDPRRFGAWLWTEQPPEQHPLLVKLGPEPLEAEFNADYFWDRIHVRATAIKALVMNNHLVVGVGNIYANESLFLAGIHPLTPGKNLSRAQSDALVTHIRQVLAKAVEQGGTTLKDFMAPSGRPGYFAQALFVYNRANQACLHCGTPIERAVHFQRASYFCPHCQPQEI